MTTNYNKVSKLNREARYKEHLAQAEPVADTVEHEEDVEELVAVETQEASTNKKGVVVNCGFLRIRKAADVNSSIVKLVEAGEELEIIDDSAKEFYQISVVDEFGDSVIAYAMKKFVTV